MVILKRRNIMKKKIILLLATVLSLAAFAACGKKDPVVQEASLGIKLENDAKEVVQQQQDSMDGADNMLDNINGD